MKLYICALLSKFGKHNYSVTLMYGNADTNCYPVPITGIKDSAVVEAACALSRRISLSASQIEQAYFCNCTTHGSLYKASRLDFTDGKVANKNHALESFRNISLSDLNDIINMLKVETKSDLFNICGDFDVRKLVETKVKSA